MAKDKTESLIKARVLMRFAHENKNYVCDDIFINNIEVVESWQSTGHVDANPDAVAYAESLK